MTTTQQSKVLNQFKKTIITIKKIMCTDKWCEQKNSDFTAN